MGLFDAIKSAFGGSDDDEETESAATDAAETDETVEEGGATEQEDETAEPDADTTETAAADTETPADSSPTADDESGFDHLTTEEISEGPDMAAETSALIQEAEPDDQADGTAEKLEAADAISDDDPRAEFVEAATELAEFWGEYDLDFTLGSLSRLDDLVTEQWESERFEDVEFGGDDYDAQVFTETVTQLGSYFGEVLVRIQDGTWQQETGTGWTVSVPAGANTEAAAGTVTVFQVAEDCLTGPSTFTGMHDALADRLDLQGRAGDGDTPVDLDRVDIETVASDAEIEEAAERLQAGAEDLADRWPDYELDFTVESLSRLEALLEEEVESDRFEGVELGDENDRESMLLTAHVVGVAGYLSAVLVRQREATWAEQGRMILEVEHDDSKTRVDPIEVAIASVRGNGSLVAAVPDAKA